MTRQRWFCCLCGNLTKREPRPDGRALCSAHMTVALDAVPPDPLESLPVTAAALTAYQCQACGGSGIEYPRNECSHCAGLGVMPSAPIREDMTPTKGMEA